MPEKDYRFYTMIPILFVLIGLIAALLINSISNIDYYKIVSKVKTVKTYKINKSKDYTTVGWLRVQGTSIDYPIIHANSLDVSYPITIEKYVWITSLDGKFKNYTNIDGHNLYNVGSNIVKHSKKFTRFEELLDFVYYDFAKENLYFQISTKDGDYIYKIFAVNLLPISSEYASEDDGYDDKNELKNYIDVLLENSFYDYNVDVNNTDKIVSLRTCSKLYDKEYSSRDFVVTGRLLRKNEKNDLYSVEKNDKYNDIEKKLNGVDIGYEV